MGFTDHARCVVPADWMADISQCWYEWQTLIAGIAAVFAALGTIWVMRKQMRQAEEFERNRFDLERKALRRVIATHAKLLCSIIREQGYLSEIDKAARLASLDAWEGELFTVDVGQDYLAGLNGALVNAGILNPDEAERSVEFAICAQIFIDSVRQDSAFMKKSALENRRSHAISTAANLARLLELGDELAAWK